jgi:hypothetical protein
MNNDIDLGRIREDLRDASKQVFSKLYRLEIAAAISAQQPPLWSRRLARSLDLAENQVTAELAAFAALGALQHFPAEHDRRKIYQVLPHPLWGFVRELLEETIRAGQPEHGEERVRAYWADVLGDDEPLPVPS